MKVVIDIPEEFIREAIRSELSKAIAQVNAEEIRTKIHEVVSLQLSRVDFYTVVRQQADKALKPLAESALAESLGPSYNRREKVDKIILQAARDALKNA